MWGKCSVVLVFLLIACESKKVPRIDDETDAVGEEADFPEMQSNDTSVISESERQTFLEWIWSLTGGGPSTEEPDQEPVIPAKCTPCSCGLSRKRIRIVGGQPVQVNQYPWMALLMYDGRFYCGATLISSKYLLSASHCVDGFTRTKMSARLMEHDRSINSESVHFERKIARIIKHGGYSDVNFNNDISLLRLDREVPFDESVSPVCLPRTGKSFTGMDGIVSGWGVHTPGGATSQILYEVTVPIMSNKDCRASKYGPRRITDNMLCAGYPEGKKDSCQGDSGGPLHIVNGSHHDIVGVVSWGEGCARPKYPGVYARVNRYLTWIKKNTKDSCFCDREGNGFTHFPPPAGSSRVGDD